MLIARFFLGGVPMKKLTVLLLALALSLCACGRKDAAQEPSAATQAPDTTPSVRLLNTIPEAEQTFQTLAGQYTARTGIPVEVVTARDDQFVQLLTGPDAPTVFTSADPQLAGDFALALDGAEIAGQLCTNDFNFYGPDGSLLAVPVELAAYGILVNVDLLERSGYTLADIHSFDTLKAVADDIQARSVELGFDAFTAAGLSPSSLRFSGHLASLPLYYEFRDAEITGTPPTITGKYLGCLRSIFDLYLADSHTDSRFLSSITDEEARIAFTSSLAVFHQGGSWEYDSLSRTVENLAILPIYCGAPGEENVGLCVDAGHYWVVSRHASPVDQQASLDFLSYLVTDRQATQPMADAFGAIPYRQAAVYTNPILANAMDLLAGGRYSVTWAFRLAPNPPQWRRTVVTALTAYAEAPSDSTWQIVVDTFVDGWAYEYKMAGIQPEK